jgi:hypothetical protein
MADYARPLHQYLQRLFETVQVFVLNGRAFSDAREAAVIVLADGYMHPNVEYRVTVSRTHDWPLVSQPSFLRNSLQMNPGQDSCQVGFSLLSSHAASTYKTMQADHRTSTLSEWADINIGVVSGANEFFVLRPQEVADLRIPKTCFRPIIARSRFLNGLAFRALDQKQIEQSNERSLLLVVGKERHPVRQIWRYIDRGRREGISKRFKCRSRRPWYHVSDAWVPDAYLHYMSSSLPHIVLNYSNCTCTNAIHRLTWKKSMSLGEKHALSVASISSLAQLSCELVGRSYGGGVLKLEPSSASKILLPVPSASKVVSDAFCLIDSMLRKGKRSRANALADEITLEGFMGIGIDRVLEIREAWQALAAHRLRLLSSSALLSHGPYDQFPPVGVNAQDRGEITPLFVNGRHAVDMTESRAV